MSYDVIVQMGHCFRKTGSTGTSGHRGTEQEFVSIVGPKMVEWLTFAGLTARTVLADEAIPSSKVFIALHQDGSTNASARGASIGYPPSNGDGRDLGQLWKAMYQQAGWPSGFRPDNYTSALSGYYGFRKTNADVKLLIEHGFATNVADENWMWDHIPQIARVNADAVVRFLQPLTPQEEDEDMVTLIDSTTGDGWVANGTKARPLTNVGAWMASWDGPVRRSANMRFVIPDLYAVV